MARPSISSHKGLANLRLLARAGLRRVHVGLESGDDEVLARICKGSSRAGQISAGQMLAAGRHRGQ